MVALSLQRWARPNSIVTSPSYSLPEQARLHALFAAAFKKFNFSSHIEALHGLVHISLGLFLTGLSLFLTLPTSVLIGLQFVTLMYISWTVLPVFRPGFPCSTPLTPVFAIVNGCVVRGFSRLLYLATSLFRICKGTGRATRGAHRHPKGYYRGWNLQKLAEDKAQGLAPRFDGDILKVTLHMLRSDDDLERFLDAIPGFCASKIVHDPRQSLDILGQQRLAEALIGFWNRTLSSNVVPESIKGRRLLICMRAIEAANLAIAAPGTLRDLSFRYLGGIARSVEVGHSLGNLRHGNVAPLARGIIAGIISSAERNDRWSVLAMDELGISRNVLGDYLARGDSVLLANLIHITRHFFHGLLQPHPYLTREALSILPSVSKFDILNTLPKLQHDFCDLWNEVVQKTRSSMADDNPFIDILVEIRRLYVDLHGTDISLGYIFTSTTGHDDFFRQPSSYPSCVMPDHYPKSTTQPQDASGSTTGVANQTITTAFPILSESSPASGDALDVSHHPATDMGIIQGIADIPISFMDEPVTQYPSSTSGYQPPDEGITVSSMVFDSPVISLETGVFILYANPCVTTQSK